MITDIDITKYDKLINSIILKYTNYYNREDLYQVAMLGLLDAKNKYRSNTNAKFTTYAYFFILGEVNKYLRESNYFKVSKDLARVNKKVEQAKQILSQHLGKIPTDEEIASYLKIDLNILLEARKANSLVDSLDKEEEQLNLYKVTGYQDPAMQEDILDLKEEIKKLQDIEQLLLSARYEYGYTQKEASTILGMSQVQVSRKEKEILTRLRSRLKT